MGTAPLALHSQGVRWTPQAAAQVDSLIPAVMRARRVLGAAVAVVSHGRVIFARGYGRADPTGAHVTENTEFRIASTTKPFTALAVLLLAQDGRLGLGDPAARYLPWLPKQYGRVTVRHLLTHTSGVPRDLRRDNLDDFSLEEFRSRLAAASSDTTPGARWVYSNTGYVLLGMIVESVSGQDLGEFLADRVFRPLGMTATRYRAPPGELGLATGYESDTTPAPVFTGGHGNGAMSSSVRDLATWVIALEDGRLLPLSAAAAMETPSLLASGDTVRFRFQGGQSGYGLGWFLTRSRNHRLVTHGGAISGFSSIVNRFADDSLAIIVLSNAKVGDDGLGHADTIARRIANLVLR